MMWVCVSTKNVEGECSRLKNESHLQTLPPFVFVFMVAVQCTTCMAALP